MARDKTLHRLASLSLSIYTRIESQGSIRRNWSSFFFFVIAQKFYENYSQLIICQPVSMMLTEGYRRRHTHVQFTPELFSVYKKSGGGGGPTVTHCWFRVGQNSPPLHEMQSCGPVGAACAHPIVCSYSHNQEDPPYPPPYISTPVDRGHMGL